MGAKSRSNYAIGINVSQDDWDKWFKQYIPKESTDESTSRPEDTVRTDDNSVQGKI